MAKPQSSERTTLSVKDFGPIVEATVELRPFTVFVGASNTGKSYLAILLYALHQFFGRLSAPFGPVYLPGRLRRLPHAPKQMSDERFEAMVAWLQKTLEEARGKREADVQLPEELAALVRPVLQDLGEMAPLLDAETKRCFGVAELGDLIRQPAGRRAQIAMRRQFSDGHAGGYDFAITRRQSQFTPAVPAAMPLRLQGANLRQLHWWLRRTSLTKRLPNEIARLIVPNVIGTVARRVHYLPADRAGVMHAHRVVVSSLIGRASRAGFEAESPLPTLSGVLADFLERLIELGEEQVEPGNERKATTGQRLAECLETDILGGDVGTARSDVGYPSFYYRPANWRRGIPLMNTSSMVSELAPVVLYLRHVVRTGDVLIIEEPESHLHPAMQVAFTRYLATVVKAGVRVVVTTHSEWVLEALANLVRLSEVAKSRRSAVANGGPALSPEEVGAWLFEQKKRPKGSVVREIPLDTVRGTFPAGFGEITEELYNDWAKITNLSEA